TNCQASLNWVRATCAFQSGVWNLTTPDGVVHPLGTVPRIGDPPTGTGAVSSLSSALIPYTVNHANEVPVPPNSANGEMQLTARTDYNGGPGASGGTPEFPNPPAGVGGVARAGPTRGGSHNRGGGAPPPPR